MRFRAKMHNTANILQLTSELYADVIRMCMLRFTTIVLVIFVTFNATTEIVTTISRSARQCVLRLSEDKLSFASLESGVLGGVNLWCELSQVGPPGTVLNCSTRTCIQFTDTYMYVAFRIFYPLGFTTTHVSFWSLHCLPQSVYKHSTS